MLQRALIHKFASPLNEVVIGRLRDKLSILYINLQKTRGHQTGQSNTFSEGFPLLKPHESLVR